MKWKSFTLWSQGVLALLVLLLATVPVNAQSAGVRNPGRPGSLNYVEGQVSIDTQAINDQSVGSAKLEPGQSVATEQGKAEILLTPGAFLRLGDNTSVKMISSGLTNTEVQVQKGRAMVEIAEIHDENNLRVDLSGATTRLLKTGLYDFDADRNQVRVFDGKVTVQENGAQIEVKDGRDLSVNSGGSLKSGKFDKKMYEDDLYNWSSLRSKYLAEANSDAAQTYVVGGDSWLGTGWYWDPWYDAYTFIPGDGFLYSPFGWGFYSPWWAYRSPFFSFGHFRHDFDHDFHGGGFHHRGFDHDGGFHHGGFDHGGGFHHGGGAGNGGGGFHHGGGAGNGGGGFHHGGGPGGNGGGGFHHGGAGNAGGGFHGGGGGFHGGGGGFHGGGGGRGGRH